MADAAGVADVAERGDAHEAAVGDDAVAMRLETTRPARAAPGVYQMTWVVDGAAPTDAAVPDPMLLTEEQCRGAARDEGLTLLAEEDRSGRGAPKQNATGFVNVHLKKGKCAAPYYAKVRLVYLGYYDLPVQAALAVARYRARGQAALMQLLAERLGPVQGEPARVLSWDEIEPADIEVLQVWCYQRRLDMFGTAKELKQRLRACGGPSGEGRSPAARLPATWVQSAGASLEVEAHPLATCPCCGGTDLFQAGGDNKKVWYYYRCKRCDPTKSGRPFKAPRPPPKIGPAAARAAAAQLPAAGTARPHLGVGHGGRNACLRGMCADPTVLAAATALRAALAGVDDARRAESDVAMAGRSSRAAAGHSFANATDSQATALAEELGLELAVRDSWDGPADTDASAFECVDWVPERNSWRAVSRDSLMRRSLGFYRSATAAAVAVAHWECVGPARATGIQSRFTSQSALEAIERALRAQGAAASPTGDGSDGGDDERPMTPLPDDFFLLPGDA